MIRRRGHCRHCLGCQLLMTQTTAEPYSMLNHQDAALAGPDLAFRIPEVEGYPSAQPFSALQELMQNELLEEKRAATGKHENLKPLSDHMFETRQLDGIHPCVCVEALAPSLCGNLVNHCMPCRSAREAGSHRRPCCVACT